MSVYVEQGGLLTTMQDAGRFGYQGYGMTPAGAMDLHSLRLANLLVGNNRDEGALEITMMGPRLRFDAEAVIAITGGNLQPKVNNLPIEMYRAVKLKSGDVLSFGGPKTGCRAYIAFSGGFDMPKEMGSYATLIRSGIGGIEGRKLKTGDVLRLRKPVLTCSPDRMKLPAEDMTTAAETEVRVVLGPQDNRFTESSIETFLTTPYEITPENDRMGYRMKGEALEHIGGPNINSDGIAFGSVQVPGNGQPIIMMADHQPTGGYTKIATVISVDTAKIAQLRAGCKLRFKSISMEEAHEAYMQEYTYLNEIEKQLQELAATPEMTQEELIEAAKLILRRRLRGSYIVTEVRPID